MNHLNHGSHAFPSLLRRRLALPGLLLLASSWAGPSLAVEPNAAAQRPNQVTAASPSHVAAAREVLEVLRVKDSVPPLVAQLSGLITDQIAQWNPSPEQQGEVDKTVAKIQAALVEEIDWRHLESDYLVLYTEAFTERELREIARFYRSPVGAKYVASAPQLQQRAITISQLRVARVQPQIETLLGDLKRHLDVIALERDTTTTPSP